MLYSIPYSPIQLSIQQFQPFIPHSTLIFKTFKYSFNIQLFIQHSTLIQHSTIHSTVNYSFNYFEPSLLLVSDTDHCLLKTWRLQRLEFRLRK